MNYKTTNISTGILGLVMVSNLILPIPTFAQETSSKQNFCDKLSQISAPIDQRIADRQAQLESRRAERSAKIARRISDRNDHKTDSREKRQANLSEHFTKLEEEAVTDAQKAAVATFKSTIQNAVNIRQNAVDAAIEALRVGTEQLIATRKAAVDTAITTFTSAKTAAVEQAKASCAQGLDSQSIRDTFRTSMKTAQDKLKNDIKAIEELKESLKTLRSSQKQALDVAMQNFKATVEQVKKDLKSSFPQ